MAASVGLTLAGGISLFGAVSHLSPISHVYPALVCGLAVWLGAHLMLGVIGQGYCLARSLAGKMTPLYDADLTNVTLLWHFITLQALVNCVVIGLLPGWMS